jgi:hypothetical protein
MNKVEWGWRGQTPPAGGEPDPGRGNFLSPRSCGQSSERLISPVFEPFGFLLARS